MNTKSVKAKGIESKRGCFTLLNLYERKAFMLNSPLFFSHTFKILNPIKNPLSTKKISRPRSPFAKRDSIGNQCFFAHVPIFSWRKRKECVPIIRKIAIALRPSIYLKTEVFLSSKDLNRLQIASKVQRHRHRQQQLFLQQQHGSQWKSGFSIYASFSSFISLTNSSAIFDFLSFFFILNF